MSTRFQEGDAAPDFTAELTDGSTVTLSEMLKESGVIIYFYPRDSTPGCTTQACDFRDNIDSLSDKGWRVIGVSKDSAKSHQKFIEKHQLPFELIVDKDIELHQLYGTWTEKKLYGRTFLGCIRSTFAINQDGTFAWVKYKVRATGHVEKLMDDLSS
ncbi:MAG: peroxiredoxin [Euryarchaeota archaeon]|jgi:peroxiredoxin Q/BCP|nr:peroxiredoxin [Euryarchaeota archaeon]